MSGLRIRPRFKVFSNYSPDEIKSRIRAKLKDGKCGCYAELSEHHLFLRIERKDQHAWSPQLDLTCEQTENGTCVRGLYGPHPHIWTFFMLSYLAIGIAALFIAMVGMVRYNLDMNANMLWSLPILALLAIGLYIASQTGQKLGSKQTLILHHLCEEVLNEDVEIS